jgi:formylglycine-generating enzyme required for sulfatase activity
LGDHSNIRAVLLNACDGGQSGDDIFSSTAATLIRRGVPAVVAMQYEITDQAAIEFARTFYEAIADGLALENAVSESRKAISFAVNNSLEWGTPVIFTHAPDGVLFELSATPPASPQKRPSSTPVVTTPPQTGSSATRKTTVRQADPQPITLPPIRKATPTQPKPILATPPSNIAIPHIITGKSPLNMKWCWIPEGKFTMGSENYDSEKPIHQVDVAGFWLGQYAVTNEQYHHFVAGGGYKQRGWWTEAGWTWREKEKISQPRYWQDTKWNGQNQPVVGVSWYEAFAFCQWAKDATGEPIRLPTEAEWEKGARSSDKRTYPWGEEEPNEKLCNFYKKVGKTTPVGNYSPQGDSPYGNVDMAGNVLEWCQSEYIAYPYKEDGRNNENGTNKKVLRGGSWDFNAFDVRTSDRDWYFPTDRNNDVGFRCASTPF